MIGLVAMLTGSIAQSVWTQTTQADFDNATTMIDVDTSISPGNVSLVPSIADWTRAQGNPVFDLGSGADWDSESVGKPSVMKIGTGYRMWFGGWNGTVSSIGMAGSNEGLIWRKLDSNPVLLPDAIWEGSAVEMVHVIEVDGEYNMWYSSGSEIGFAESSDGLSWTKASGNPVLTPGQPGEWDDAGVRDSAVLYENGIFKMWYAGYDGSNHRLGYAESNDGRIWTKSLLNPVLDPGPAAWDSLFVWDPFVLNLTGTFHMWYMGSDTSYLDGQIGYATSPDGVNWIKHPSNPVLSLGTAGSWEDREVGGPFVIAEDGTFKMWYTGHDGLSSRIGYAVSIDGINWNRGWRNPLLGPDAVPGSVLQIGGEYKMWYNYGVFTSNRIGYANSTDGFAWTEYPANPVIPLGAWHSDQISMPSVIWDGSFYHMLYVGQQNSPLNRAIGHATSPDGVSWTKEPSANPILSASSNGNWDDEGVSTPSLLWEDVEFKMWYGGHDGSTWRVGYATSSDGVSWTRFPGNPVLDVGPVGAWDESAVSHPSVFRLNGLYYMYYTNAWDATQGSSTGFAWSADGENWTKHGGNPVFEPGDVGSWDDEAILGGVVSIHDGVPKLWYGGWDGSSAQMGLALLGADHTSTRIFESEVFDSGSLGTSWESLNWTGSVPSQTSIAFSVRTGDTDQPDASWSSWSAESTVNDIPTQMPRAGKIQYRAVLTSSVVDAAPVLEEVRIYYALNQESPPTPQSPTEGDEVTSPMFSWIYDDPEGDAQVAFIVEVGDSVDFSSIDYSSGEVDSSDTGWVPDESIPAGEWYWRVRTMDEYGLWSGNSDLVSFTVTEVDTSFIEDWWWVIIVLAVVTALVLIILLYSRKREEEAPQEVHETEEREPPMETQQREMEMTDEGRLEKLEKRHEEGHISDETYEELKERYGGESDRTE